jgi:hypothetical protein
MKILSTIIALLFTCNCYSQNYFDPEPIKFCIQPFDFSLHKFKYILPYFKNDDETESEFQNRIAKYKIENARVDKENEQFELEHKKYFADSIKYENCNAEWQAEVLAWRNRNPNWRRTANFKGEITINPKELVQTIKEDAINGEKYKVIIETLNLRTGPGKNYTTVKSLKLDDEVTLINSDVVDWWYVDYGGVRGYVFGQMLKKDPNSGWNMKHYESGETPECENVDPQYDYKLDNYLKVNVGSHTDVVIKLMKKQLGGDICIRIIFIRSNETYYLRNIPEGNYYLKIAYGSDWRQKIVDQQCFGKFMKNAQYEIGLEKLDFNVIHKNDRDLVPYFELSLDVIVTQGTRPTFKSNDISEAEFNK